MSFSSALVRWSRTKWADACLALAMFGIGTLLYLSGGARPVLPGFAQPLWLELSLLGAACLAQTQRRRFPVLNLYGVFVATGFAGFAAAPLLVLIDALFAATLYAGERASRIVVRTDLALVLTAMIAALVFIPDWRQALQSALGVFSVSLVPVWWAMQVRHHREIAMTARERAEEQARLAELNRRAAVAEERGRMARDLHDVISGHVSAIAIQSEAVLQLADGGDPKTVQRVLRSVRENSVAALTEMRAMIELLRAEEGAEQDQRTAASRLRDLDQLVDSARAGGLSVRVDDTPAAARDLPVAVDLAAYRIVQEALTNVVKHAAGANTVLTLDREQDRLIIQVTNELPGPVTERGRGTGLLSMTERAQAVGGSLDAGENPGGWRVRAELPTEQPAGQPSAAQAAGR